jgi:hypothetical protein
MPGWFLRLLGQYLGESTSLEPRLSASVCGPWVGLCAVRHPAAARQCQRRAACHPTDAGIGLGELAAAVTPVAMQVVDLLRGTAISTPNTCDPVPAPPVCQRSCDIDLLRQRAVGRGTLSCSCSICADCPPKKSLPEKNPY